MLRSILVFLSLMAPPNYDIAKEQVRSSWDVDTIFHDFAYKADETEADEWLMPEDFYARKCGDCEDFALMAYDMLGEKGYIVTIYVFEKKEMKHAICHYKKGGDEGYFSNAIRYNEDDWTPEEYMKNKPEYYAYEIVFTNDPHVTALYGDFGK